MLAQASNNVYIVTLPLVGGPTPTISISDTSSASFPIRRLTRVGGDFIGWAPDAKSVYWSIGRSFFRYDPVVADSLGKIKVRTDSLRADSLKSDSVKAKPDSVELAQLSEKLVERSGVAFKTESRSPEGP